MDSLTLSFVIIMFLASLALYFATASVVAIPDPLPEMQNLPKFPKCAINLDNIRIAPVLRQNVVVARFARMDR